MPASAGLWQARLLPYVAVKQVTSWLEDTYHFRNRSLPIGDVMSGHARCDDVELSIGKFQLGGIYGSFCRFGRTAPLLAASICFGLTSIAATNRLLVTAIFREAVPTPQPTSR
jgi:hypothetical protein